MFEKVKLILLMISLSVSVCLMSNTYSRYVADTTSSIEAPFAKWQIMVNSNDITNENSTNLTFTPSIDENVNVAEGTVAPSSKGHFDIVIDATNVDVSFNYNIALQINNENMPDLLITKYAVLPDDGSALQYTTLNDYSISSDFTHSATSRVRTIRIFFEWREGTTTTVDEITGIETTISDSMNDEADTQVGIDAATNDTMFSVTANIGFTQIV